MALDKLLKTDPEAADLFFSLTPQAQIAIRHGGEEIATLDALRDHTAHIISHEGPFYPKDGVDGTKLDPELKAQWTKEHQA